MRRKDLITSVTDAAAILYREYCVKEEEEEKPKKRAEFTGFVIQAMDQYKIKDTFERSIILRAACKNLGIHGNRRKTALKKRGLIPRKPLQLSFRFRPA